MTSKSDKELEEQLELFLCALLRIEPKSKQPIPPKFQALVDKVRPVLAKSLAQRLGRIEPMPKYKKIEMEADPYHSVARWAVSAAPAGYRFLRLVRKGTKARATYIRIDPPVK